MCENLRFLIHTFPLEIVSNLRISSPLLSIARKSVPDMHDARVIFALSQ